MYLWIMICFYYRANAMNLFLSIKDMAFHLYAKLEGLAWDAIFVFMRPNRDIQ